MKKVICTHPGECELCNEVGYFDLVKGRAYTVTEERGFGPGKLMYKLKEFIVPAHIWICSPHFAEITPADEDIFTLADRPVRFAAKSGVPCTPVHDNREKVR